MILRYAIYSANEALVNKLPGITDLTSIKPELYSTYPQNEHHWTTKWVWENFIPRLMHDLKIPFVDTDFNYVSCIYDGQDLSYHIPKNDNMIDLLDLYTSTRTKMYIQDTFFNEHFTSPLGATTGYHRLFIYSHRCCLIDNTHCIRNESLLLNTDSMSVPVIAALIPYFKHILILDNRTNSSYKQHIDDFIKANQQTMSYVELFIADSYNFHKYALNLK